MEVAVADAARPLRRRTPVAEPAHGRVKTVEMAARDTRLELGQMTIEGHQSTGARCFALERLEERPGSRAWSRSWVSTRRRATPRRCVSSSGRPGLRSMTRKAPPRILVSALARKTRGAGKPRPARVFWVARSRSARRGSCSGESTYGPPRSRTPGQVLSAPLRAKMTRRRCSYLVMAARASTLAAEGVPVSTKDHSDCAADDKSTRKVRWPVKVPGEREGANGVSRFRCQVTESANGEAIHPAWTGWAVGGLVKSPPASSGRVRSVILVLHYGARKLRNPPRAVTFRWRAIG